LLLRAAAGRETFGNQHSLKAENTMWFIIALLFILWLIGFISLGSAAYWIHILLVVAVVLFILNLLRGRRTTI
jgi:hypothetical protein